MKSHIRYCNCHKSIYTMTTVNRRRVFSYQHPLTSQSAKTFLALVYAVILPSRNYKQLPDTDGKIWPVSVLSPLAAFLTQTVCLDDTTVKFEIWDTAGQERYHSLAPMYYRGAQAAIVVYDITNEVSPNTLCLLCGLNDGSDWVKLHSYIQVTNTDCFKAQITCKLQIWELFKF